MVAKNINKTITVDEYYHNPENEGKIGIISLDSLELVAEGDCDSDWVEMELLYEGLREEGNYRMVIVPRKSNTIQSFQWRMLA